MPISKSAKKALRRDQRRRKINLKIKIPLKRAIKSARKDPTPKALGKAFSWLDQAVKKNLIHKNKASRLKSRLSSLQSK